MSRDKQMVDDLIEIFDEEHSRRYLITPQNTAEKLTAKGYRKSADVAEEIFAEIEGKLGIGHDIFDAWRIIDELKKKYTEEDDYGT